MSEIHIQSGTNYAVAIHHMITVASPDARVLVKPTRLTTPHLIYRDPNPWRDAEDLALAIGMRIRRRGDRVTVRHPWSYYLLTWRFRFNRQIRVLLDRVEERMWPPVEYPDPDYGDWEDTND